MANRAYCVAGLLASVFDTTNILLGSHHRKFVWVERREPKPPAFEPTVYGAGGAGAAGGVTDIALAFVTNAPLAALIASSAA